MRQVPGTDSSRRAKSQQTRKRMLEESLRLFVEHGYDGTTIEAIARASAVAVQTVYFKFGNKQTILKELVDVAVAGDDEPVPTLERPWAREILDAPDAPTQLRRQVTRTREIYERVGPLLEVLRSAAVSNEEIAALWERNKQQRLTVHQHLTRALANRQPLPEGLDFDRAVDIAYGLLGPEVYHLWVTERGWTPGEWADWTYATLCHHLLPER